MSAAANGATLWLFVGYQAVWLVSALAAAAGSALPGVVAALALILLAVWRTAERRGLMTLAGASAGLGFIAESMLAAAGLVAYRAAFDASLAPAWIVTLWAAFAVALAPFRRLLGTNALAKAAVIGALLGPLAYLAGARLGALALTEPSWRALAALAVVWALSLPALLALAARLEQSLPAPAESRS